MPHGVRHRGCLSEQGVGNEQVLGATISMDRGHRPRRVLVSIVAFVLVCGWPAFAAASDPRAFVLDTGNKTVAALDVEKGAVQGSVALDGNLTSMMQVPHSPKLVVFDQGRQERVRFTTVGIRRANRRSRLSISWG